MTEQTNINKHLSTSSEDIDDNNKIDPDSRIEFLERNLQYIQQQHETTLFDLHNEINRLQQENKDLHYRLINISEQKQQTIDQLSSTTPDKSINENQIQFEEKINELEKQLYKSEEKNKYLTYKIDELNQIALSKPEKSDTDDNQSSARTSDSDYQQLLSVLHEKQQQYLQEIAKLRTVLLEILNTERLTLVSKTLVRDCLTSTNISEISMSKTTTTPIDMLFNDEKQQRSNLSPSLIGKSSSNRHELHIRRLNISPPQITMPRSNNQQRVNLPIITQRINSTLSQHSSDANNLLHHTMTSIDYAQYQRLFKVGETPIARRERRTQELQKNRLTKNLYH